MKFISNTSSVLKIDRRAFLANLVPVIGAVLVGSPIPGRAQGRGMSAVSDKPLAPLMRIPDAHGKTVDLASFQGKVVLVNFWATWCPPCRQELPSVHRLRQRFGPEFLQILSVNVGEDPETVFDFIGNPGFPILFDHDAKTMARWAVKVIPTTLLIDRQGRIAFRAVGGREFDDEEIITHIRLLLKS